MRMSSFVLGMAASLVVATAFGQNDEIDPLLAEALAKAAPQKNAMLLCFDAASIKFAVQTCEPAETVIEAAFGTCREAEQAYAGALVKYLGVSSRAAVINGLSQVKQQLRQSLLPVVFKARLGSESCRNSN